MKSIISKIAAVLVGLGSTVFCDLANLESKECNLSQNYTYNVEIASADYQRWGPCYLDDMGHTLDLEYKRNCMTN